MEPYPGVSPSITIAMLSIEAEYIDVVECANEVLCRGLLDVSSGLLQPGLGCVRACLHEFARTF